MRADVPAARRPAIQRPTGAAPGQVGEQWVLEMPFQTPLSLNDRMQHIVKWRTKTPWREAAHTLARAAKIPPCRRVEIALWYTPKDDRARDPLNLVEALKVIEDGIVDAGVIPDDSQKYHTSVMPQITKKGPLRPRGNRLWVVVTRLA